MKIKVICLNLWFGGKLFENIKQYISEENPDIIALQEVYNAESYPPAEKWHPVGNLAQILGYKYFAFVPAFARTEPNGIKAQNGNAILSKFPIQNSIATFYDEPFNGFYIQPEGDARNTPRNLQHGEINIEGKVLHFFNTQGIWGFDGDDTDRRLHMGEVISSQVAGKQPALLMGDFNTQEGNQTIGKIEAHMRSIFKGEMKTSFNMKHKPKESGYGKAIVDMMFVSPDVKVVSHNVSSADVSDHLALVAEFEIFE